MLIELTGSVGGNKVMIDVSSIVGIESHDNGKCVFICKNDYNFTPLENYSVIKEMFMAAGISIINLEHQKKVNKSLDKLDKAISKAVKI